MLVKLVRATTSDGLCLDGALARPKPEVLPSITVDAFVLLYGVGGNFYSGSLFLALLPAFLSLGANVLRVNTRGHGTVNMVPTTGVAG